MLSVSSACATGVPHDDAQIASAALISNRTRPFLFGIASSLCVNATANPYRSMPLLTVRPQSSGCGDPTTLFATRASISGSAVPDLPQDITGLRPQWLRRQTHVRNLAVVADVLGVGDDAGIVVHNRSFQVVNGAKVRRIEELSRGFDAL